MLPIEAGFMERNEGTWDKRFYAHRRFFGRARGIEKIQWMQKGMELGEISSVHRNAQKEKQKQLGSFISYVELK